MFNVKWVFSCIFQVLKTPWSPDQSASPPIKLSLERPETQRFARLTTDFQPVFYPFWSQAMQSKPPKKPDQMLYRWAHLRSPFFFGGNSCFSTSFRFQNLQNRPVAYLRTRSLQVSIGHRLLTNGSLRLFGEKGSLVFCFNTYLYVFYKWEMIVIVYIFL